MPNFLRHRGLDILLGLLLLILLLILTGLLLVGHTPAFYKDYSRVSLRELERRAGRILKGLLEATSLVHQGEEFQLEIQEDDLNILLAGGILLEDFLPHSLENLQVHFLPPKGEELGEVILAAKTRNFHLDTVISVYCRLERKGQGLKVKVKKIRAGALPIPQRPFKNIISAIEDARLENIFQKVEIIDLKIEEARLRIVGRGRSKSE